MGGAQDVATRMADRPTLTKEQLTIPIPIDDSLTDEQRRQVWIEHFVEQGEYQEAVALGWDFAQPPDPRVSG